MGDAQGSSETEPSRERRTRGKRDEHMSRFEALKKLRETGEKKKYQVGAEPDSLYEEVSEEEYSRRVRDRLADDFVVDDDGSGYVDDGKEIFDEEMEVPRSKRGKKPETENTKSKGTRNIKTFCSTNVKLKSETNVTVSQEEVEDLLAVLHGTVGANAAGKVLSTKQTKVAKSENLNVQRHKPSANAVNPFAISGQIENRSSASSRDLPSVRSEVSSKRGFSSPLKAPSKLPRPSTTPEKQGRGKFQERQNIMSHLLEDFEDSLSVPLEGSDDLPNGMTGGINDENSVDDCDLEAMQVDTESIAGADHVATPAPRAPTEKKTSCMEWNDVAKAPVDEEAPMTTMDFSNFSEVLNVTKSTSDGSQCIRMYWLDVHEESLRNSGTIFLFGKTKSKKGDWLSLCTIIRNVERVIHVIPKLADASGVKYSLEDVYHELKTMMEKSGVPTFRCKAVKKQYCFEVADIPRGEMDVLEVRYSAKYPALSTDLAKGDSFTHVFGIHTTSLERFLLERKMKGPGWLEISNPEQNDPAVTWCSIEIKVDGVNCITPLVDAGAPPPMKMMALNLVTHKSTTNKQTQVIAAGLLMTSTFPLDQASNPGSRGKHLYKDYVCLLAKPDDHIFPFDLKDTLKAQKGFKLETCQREKGLLTILLAKIKKFDPDIIVGHDLCGFQLDILLQRIAALKLPNWSRVGRLKKAHMPKLHGWKGALLECFCGRLVLDAAVSARELVRCKGYDLEMLVEDVLKEEYKEPCPIAQAFQSSSGILDIGKGCLNDALYSLRIAAELNAVPLAVGITQVVGGVLSRTLLGGRSERNEYLLLHAFYEKGFICPDRKTYEGRKKGGGAMHAAQADEFVALGSDDEGEKQAAAATVELSSSSAPSGSNREGRRKPAYAGGLVLDPKRGYYDNFILLLDFNSLYPSIIQEYNICHTTIDLAAHTDKNSDVLPDLPSFGTEPGILPTEIRKLVDSRRQVKQLLKSPNLSPDQALQYNIRQIALKLTANSMYGCLGFGNSRFFARPLAALITSKGREILMQTKEIVEKLGEEVIYGDTDSIMINTSCDSLDQAMAVGKRLKGEVNKMFRKLELDIDAVYKSLLLLKKKKYAGLRVDVGSKDGKPVRETKGLDIVRRDWADIAKEAGNTVLDYLLSGESRETILENIHDYLTKFSEEMNSGKFPVEKFQIAKQLTKDPSSYGNAKGLPHVNVALRLNESGKSRSERIYRQGDTISYVVCQDGTSSPAALRAYHPSEMASNKELTLDLNYYMSRQVHPVVARLCEPIEGTSSARIAECLGLDPSGYHSNENKGDDNDQLLMGLPVISTDKSEPFTFQCSACKTQDTMHEAISSDGCIRLNLSFCANPDCEQSPSTSIAFLENSLQMQIRSFVRKYYKGILRCEDKACGHISRRIPIRTDRGGHPICTACQSGSLVPEYNELDLLSQIYHLYEVFDLDTAWRKVSEADKTHLRDQYKSTKQCYAKLRSVAQRWLEANAYSEINLGLLFGSIFPPSSAKSKMCA